LSVSRVEAWIKNPYDIFAREILRLEPLDRLGLEPQPSLRGSLIHEALSRFAKAYPHELPSDAKGELVRFAREALEDYAAHARIAAFWVPRFERFAEWFAETEPGRRATARAIIAETAGSHVLEAPAGPFTLTARADRIDVTEEGLIITDYKTGRPPKEKDVLSFAAPQLPLEAAIALHGAGFAEVPKERVAGLRFISAAGGEPPGEECDIEADDFGALAAEAVRGLSHRVARFDDPATPYRALRRPGFSYAFDAYAHLARVAEWSADATGDEEG
jgi:ATP-dependent helicase/nuclease subunit B